MALIESAVPLMDIIPVTRRDILAHLGLTSDQMSHWMLDEIEPYRTSSQGHIALYDPRVLDLPVLHQGRVTYRKGDDGPRCGHCTIYIFESVEQLPVHWRDPAWTFEHEVRNVGGVCVRCHADGRQHSHRVPHLKQKAAG